jgi:hypothetical protein
MEVVERGNDFRIFANKPVSGGVPKIPKELHIRCCHPHVAIVSTVAGQEIHAVETGSLHIAQAGGKHGEPAIDALRAHPAMRALYRHDTWTSAAIRLGKQLARAIRVNLPNYLGFGQPLKWCPDNDLSFKQR